MLISVVYWFGHGQEDQERINESVKRTISRYTEKIKDDRDSPPSRRDRSSSKDSPRPTKST